MEVFYVFSSLLHVVPLGVVSVVVGKRSRPLFLPILETPNRKDLDPPPRRDPLSFPQMTLIFKAHPLHTRPIFCCVVERRLSLLLAASVMLLITEKRNASLTALALHAVHVYCCTQADRMYIFLSLLNANGKQKKSLINTCHKKISIRSPWSMKLKAKCTDMRVVPCIFERRTGFILSQVCF